MQDPLKSIFRNMQNVSIFINNFQVIFIKMQCKYYCEVKTNQTKAIQLEVDNSKII